MQNRIKVSVCLASFEGINFIKDQIDSILQQLPNNAELLVADDGSLDGTLEFLSEYESRIKIIYKERVGGVVRNFSRLLNYADGDIIILSDQDDVWLPNRLKRMLTALEDVDLVRMNGYMVNENLEKNGLTLFDLIPPKSGFLANIFRNSYVGCSLAFRREILRGVVPMPDLIPWHDWYIGLIAELFYKVSALEEPGFLYRRHSSNVSQTGFRSDNSFNKKIFMRFKILIGIFIFYYKRISLIKSG